VNDVRFVPPLAVGSVPVTPVVKGSPVALVRVALVGVPNTVVTNVGEVAKTAEPVPVSSVKAERRLAELGVARKVATPVPKPDTPVAIGRPVAFVKVALVGVPRMGVTRVGDVAKTADPVPVSSVKALKRLAELNEPKDVALPTEVTAPVKLALVVTLPAVKPEAVPVIFVPTKADGVPKAGVTKVGLVANTKEPVPVSSVTAEIKLADDGVPKNVATPVPKPLTPVEIGRPVMLVATPEAGVPKAGVTRVGLFDRTTEPVPVDEVTPVPPLATGRVPVMSPVLILIASHVAFVPSVWRYLLELPVWLGNRLFKAAVAVEAPVPPSAMAKSVIPLIEPPVIAAAELSVFVEMAVEMLLNSVSISVPRTILSGSPGDKLSLVAKFVDFV
jgi:hypothetical protein